MPRVLACLADSPRAQAVARAAQQWARTLGADLTYLHVAEDESAAWRWTEQGGGAIESAQGAEVVVEHGDPSSAICRVAEQKRVDLVVLGALEQEKLVTSIMGSVARRVARRAPCSVLLLTDPNKAAVQRIVTSISFDKQSAAMLHFVLQLARAYQVQALHVIHEYDAYSGMLRMLGHGELPPSSSAQDYLEVSEGAAMEQLTTFLAGFDFDDLPVHAESLDGHIGQEAVEFAQQQRADLLVIPSPPRLSFWDRFFKHPAELAMQHLPCSLLLYRTSKEHTS